MTFLWHPVAAPLSAHIHFLYQWQGPIPHARDAIFPLPASDMKFNLGGPLRLHEDDASRDTVCRESWCVGIWDHRHIIEWPATPHFLGVRFRPGGARAFLGVPLGELHNRMVPLDELWGPLAAEICERLYEARTPARRFAIVEEVLLARLSDAAPPPRIVSHVAGRITAQHGAVSIGALCDEVGVSRKHLVTLFRDHVGCTPKALARLSRFARVLESIDPTQPANWTNVAHDNDYFDQSHFSRDFSAYTGLTPSAYFKVRHSAGARAGDPEAVLGVTPLG